MTYNEMISANVEAYNKAFPEAAIPTAPPAPEFSGHYFAFEDGIPADPLPADIVEALNAEFSDDELI